MGGMFFAAAKSWEIWTARLIFPRQPLIHQGIQVCGRTAAPFPPTSLSGEGPEGGVAAVSARFHVRRFVVGSRRTRHTLQPVYPFKVRYTKYMRFFCRFLFFVSLLAVVG